MKKFLLCSLAAVMILSFAACTNGTDDKKDDQSGKQTQTGVQQNSNELALENPDQHKMSGHGVPELVPEWVDGQEYPQGEDEPVDNGTVNQQSSKNQKEEPDQHNIAPDKTDGKSNYQVGEPIWED